VWRKRGMRRSKDWVEKTTGALGAGIRGGQAHQRAQRDASRRISRHFADITPDVTPWEDDALPLELVPPGVGRRRIVVLAGLASPKVLTSCWNARDAKKRRLKLNSCWPAAASMTKSCWNRGHFRHRRLSRGGAA